MAKGFRNRILHVDLGSGQTSVETPGEDFFRAYLGGGALGSYYLLRQVGGEEDPLDAGNPLIISAGVTTGALVTGASRCSVTALSPLTRSVGEGQAGGEFGPALKRAGASGIITYPLNKVIH